MQAALERSARTVELLDARAAALGTELEYTRARHASEVAALTDALQSSGVLVVRARALASTPGAHVSGHACAQQRSQELLTRTLNARSS